MTDNNKKYKKFKLYTREWEEDSDGSDSNGNDISDGSDNGDTTISLQNPMVAVIAMRRYGGRKRDSR